MNGYNFTERVRKVLQFAREEAFALRHEYVGTEHLLLGLVREGEGVAAAALQNVKIELAEVRDSVLKTIKPGPSEPATKAEGAAGILDSIAGTIGLGRRQGPDLPYTSRAKKVLELAMSEARELQHSYVGTEHLLLGLLREERGIGAQVLASLGATTEKIRTEVLTLLGDEMKKDETAIPVQRRPREVQAAITLVVEHPDGRIEAKKFRRAGDAVSFLKELEY